MGERGEGEEGGREGEGGKGRSKENNDMLELSKEIHWQNFF